MAEKGFDIPSIDQALDAKLRGPLERIRQALQTLQGFRGDGLVGGHLKSTNYVEGLEGWRIKPDGDAEFYRVKVRGAIEANSGKIGGATIGFDYVQSTGFVAGTSGWRLDNTTGTAEFFDIVARGDIKATGIEVGTSPAISGTTMTGSGAIIQTDGKFALGDASTNITYNGSILTFNGEVAGKTNLKANSASRISGSTAGAWGLVSHTITVTADDIPDGETTVPIVVTACADVIASTFFDIGVNESPWTSPGTLLETLPPEPGVQAYTVIYDAAPGTYEFGCFNHGAGDAADVANTRGRVITVQIGLR